MKVIIQVESYGELVVEGTYDQCVRLTVPKGPSLELSSYEVRQLLLALIACERVAAAVPI